MELGIIIFSVVVIFAVVILAVSAGSPPLCVVLFTNMECGS